MDSNANARHRRLRSQDIMMDLSFVRLKDEVQKEQTTRNSKLMAGPIGISMNAAVKRTLLPSLLTK